jgi:hypothetical protein
MSHYTEYQRPVQGPDYCLTHIAVFFTTTDLAAVRVERNSDIKYSIATDGLAIATNASKLEFFSAPKRVIVRAASTNSDRGVWVGLCRCWNTVLHVEEEVTSSLHRELTAAAVTDFGAWVGLIAALTSDLVAAQNRYLLAEDLLFYFFRSIL